MGVLSPMRKICWAAAAWLAGAILSGPAAVASSLPTHDEGASPLLGVLSAFRVGYAAHDVGVFGTHKEGGKDYNFEFVFVSPDFLGVIWSPKPVVGASINDSSNTNQVYGGLTWEMWFWERFFFNFTFGVAGAPNAKISTPDRTDRKELGSKVLFREAIELGWNIYKRDSISVYLDHISHGTLFNDENEGLDTAGIRYTYRF